ncbi:hypothetical protein ACFQJD_17370 [Haloplanus sp. GCM10025708]|uniref:CRISPR-associated protein Cas4 n=1 Tax=Haloferacaceae TaxID=1644056 RepID=UPI00361A78EA
MPTFSDLSRAAYCLRQCYYVRRDDDRAPPPEVEARRRLAFEYADRRDAADAILERLPIEPSPATYRAALDRLAARDDWDELADPSERSVRLHGKDCRGVADKLLAGDPPTPTFVSPGTPPESGVWKPQRVRAVAIAKALAWEREREIPRAIVEYPAYGVVRTVRLTTRNRAAYRRTVRHLRELDGPPPRVDDRSKCESCDYRTECGVKTHSLRSLLDATRR